MLSAENSSKFLNPEVKIIGNSMSFNQETLQISSISHIWIGEIEKSSWWLIIGLLTSFAIIGIFLIIYYFKKNKKTLNICLNSGKIYTLTSKSETFYSSAFCKLSNIIANQTRRDNITLNFGNGTIVNGAVVNNGITSVGN